MALKTGAKMVVNADAHVPGDFLTAEMARFVALGAGLSDEDYRQIQVNMNDFVDGLAIIR
jgi:hypothetical protein